MTDVRKVITLNRLRAQMLDETISPAQKKYYLDLAQWLEQQNIQTAEEATHSIRNTPYYDGAALAKELDGIHLRIKAARELGFKDVEELYTKRYDKLLSKGLKEYAFSQEWIDGYNQAQKLITRHLQEKEIFARIFCNYIRIAIIPEQKQRQESIKNLNKALEDLEKLDVSFSGLVCNKVFTQLTMTTEDGLKHFIDFIEKFQKSGIVVDTKDRDQLKKEQKRIGQWAKKNASKLMDVGKLEQWNRASCIAVPSENSVGYDFIAMKEVKG